MKLVYEFPSTGGGVQNGFNDGSMENFRGYVPYYVAREALQNAIDAVDKDESGNEKYPVRVKIDLINIKGSQIPENEQLAKILSACNKYWPKDKKARRFFKNAWDLVSRNRDIQTLRISDYNTTGLTENNYRKLMKVDGVAEKEGDKGGSFGLGKHAFFIASSFRTFFVSSIYEKNKHIFQGRLKLVSFRKDDDIKQSSGFFGYQNLEPVRDPETIPGIFSREGQGTDVYILGFRWGNTWKEDIVKTTLNYYWNAILNGMLRVDVGDTEIRKDNLEELLNNYFSEDGPDDNRDNPNPWPYYRAYMTPDGENGKRLFKRNFPVLKDVELHILPGESYRKKIACIRKTGMIIQKIDKRNPEAFAGVFICRSEGNDILREMENAAHDKWSVHNATDSSMEDKRIFNKAMKELDEFITDSLKEMVPINIETTDIPGLESILSIPGADNEEKEARGNLQDDRREGPEVGIRKREEAVKTIFPMWKKEKDKPVKPTIPGRKLYSIGFRSLAQKDSETKKTKHILIIRDDKKKEFDLVLMAGTDDSFLGLNIIKAFDEEENQYKTDGNEIKNMKTKFDGLLKMTVEFESDERFSLKADAYESK